MGLIVKHFLPSYFNQKGRNLATKEDIGKITKEIETVKTIYREKYDLSKTERKFYNDMITHIQGFLVIIKRYELTNGLAKNSVTKKVVMETPELKDKYLNFIDSANETIARAFVFLGENNYNLLHNAIPESDNFAQIRYNLLTAMRRSIHSETKFLADKDSHDFKY